MSYAVSSNPPSNEVKYIQAMLNANILDLTLPLPEFLAGHISSLDAAAAHARLTKTLEWSIRSCLLDHIFSRRFVVRRAFLDDEEALRRRFIWTGLVHVALVPFIAGFMTMHFFLLHAQEWRDKKHYLGPREWSPIARWSFRELNELPHVFETRLAASRKLADAYLKLFPRPMIAALARSVAFVSGALVAVLLALAAILDGGDSILLYIKLGERNLLWYAGAASATFAVSRAFVPSDPEDHNSLSCASGVPHGLEHKTSGINPAEMLMQRLSEHTHCFPDEWRGKAHTQDVRDTFSRAFRYKVWLFSDEVMSVFFAPLILCFSLSSSASSVLQFVRDNTVDISGLGSVLGHSLFDFEAYGNAKYGSPTEGCKPTEHGKMEKSFLNFSLNHPEWAQGDQRIARLLKDVRRCASMEFSDKHSEDSCMPVDIDHEMSYQLGHELPCLNERQLGVSFERLDQYAASMRSSQT